MKARKLLMWSAATFFMNVSAGESAFLDPYWSSRVAALGGAFMTVTDDATGMFYNPAALAGNLQGRQSNFSYAKLFAGLDGVKLGLNQAAYAQSLGRALVLGIGWANMTASDLYREDTVAVGVARAFKDLIPGGGSLSVGVTGKYLMRGYVLNQRSVRDPVFANGSRNHAVAFDLHLYSVPSPALPGLALGLTVRSLNRPTIGIRSNEQLPLEVIGGLSYRWNNVRVPIDVTSRNGSLEPHVGAEMFFAQDRIALRLGGDMNQVGMGFGYRYDLNTKFSIILDYAFIMPMGVQGTVGSHRATFGLKF